MDTKVGHPLREQHCMHAVTPSVLLRVAREMHKEKLSRQRRCSAQPDRMSRAIIFCESCCSIEGVRMVRHVDGNVLLTCSADWHASQVGSGASCTRTSMTGNQGPLQILIASFFSLERRACTLYMEGVCTRPAG